MVGITLISVVTGITIYLISQAGRKGKTDADLIAEGLAQREISEDLPAGMSPDVSPAG